MTKKFDDVERSESGARIYRHADRARAWIPPKNPTKHLNEIEAHIEKYVGKIQFVYHELISDLIHLDVLIIDPTPQRPYYILVTSGVSDEPMNVPDGMEKFNRAELIIALPESWSLTQESLKDETYSWPIRWLKQIGRLPHAYNTWVGWGHTIPNGNPAKFIANTKFVGMMLCPPYLFAPELFQLPLQSNEAISFYMLAPLYAEEMELKLKKGGEELERRLVEQGVGFLINPLRKNVASEM